MKAKLISDHIGTHPDLLVTDRLGNPDLAATTRNVRQVMDQFNAGELTVDQYRARRFIELPAGTIMEGPKAYQLVMLGVAEPADAECSAAVPARVLNNMAEVQEAQNRVATGTATGTSADAGRRTRRKAARRKA